MMVVIVISGGGVFSVRAGSLHKPCHRENREFRAPFDANSAAEFPNLRDSDTLGDLRFRRGLQFVQPLHQPLE
jgi:hypothetical protein